MILAVLQCIIPKATTPLHAILSLEQTRECGRMSRTSFSRFGRLENPNIACLNPGRVKPMTLKLIIVTS